MMTSPFRDPPVDLLSARDAVAAGLRPSDDRRLVRVRHGVYADRLRWDALEPWERYLARVHAVAVVSPHTVFALESAAALWGMPVFGEPRFFPSPPGVRPPKSQRRPAGDTRSDRAAQVSEAAAAFPVTGARQVPARARRPSARPDRQPGSSSTRCCPSRSAGRSGNRAARRRRAASPSGRTDRTGRPVAAPSTSPRSPVPVPSRRPRCGSARRAASCPRGASSRAWAAAAPRRCRRGC